MNMKTEVEPTEEEIARWSKLAYPTELKPNEEPRESEDSQPKKMSFGSEEPLSGLEPLQLFQYKRHVYGKHRVHHAGVTCVSIKGDKVVTLAPDTLVKPVAMEPVAEAPEPEPAPEPAPEPEPEPEPVSE